MRFLIIGILVALFGPIAVKIREYFMSRAPQWVWRLAAWGCVLAGTTIFVLSDPIFLHAKSHLVLTALLASSVALVSGTLLVVMRWSVDLPLIQQEPKLTGTIDCFYAKTELNMMPGKNDLLTIDCNVIVNVTVINDGKGTTVRDFTLALMLDDGVYPGKRVSIDGYIVTRAVARISPFDLQENPTVEKLTLFPTDKTITNENDGRGWLRFMVSEMELDVGEHGESSDIKGHVTVRLCALDRKGRPHTVFEGPRSALPPCGLIVRHNDNEVFFA